MECCKTTNPSIYRSEIQNKLVKNDFQCLPENIPSIHRSAAAQRKILVYILSRNLAFIPQESLTFENENILFQYLSACMGNTFL